MTDTTAGLLQVALLIAALGLSYQPLGAYMARVYSSQHDLRVERVVYRLVGVDPRSDQRWPVYTASLLAFSAVSVVGLYALQRMQPHLPLGLGFPGVAPDAAFNTATSFVTNPNWQSYSGVSTMGDLVQMAGLAVQNFASAAVGMTVAIALIRGFVRKRTDRVGNFWVDLVRGCVRILLPIAIVGTVLLVAMGAGQNFTSMHDVTTLAGHSQTITGGPVASQEVIKELGTNGGGFYNANSAHPFENPNPLSNILEIFLLLVIPVAFTRSFGVMVGDKRQGYAILAAMGVLWLVILGSIVDGISTAGGTPLVVAEHTPDDGARTLGVINLKDVVKTGMRERFDEMRRMGIRTVMITGDNPLTARAIAEEAGVDDFLAEATPEDKMRLIKAEQEGGRLVAMTGDGTNDAPALAQSDVGVAMNTGTSAAKEAGNMVDLDSNPTKLIEVVEIGKQLLITRGSLTTFSIANDIAKYFAIIPAMFAGVYAGLDKLNVMHLATPESAILSAVIFNALIIIALIPLALRGVRFTPSSASSTRLS